MIDIYESAVDNSGVFGCVFERDDESAFFYLLDMTGPEHRIIAAFNAHRLTTMPADIPTMVGFSALDHMAGLLVDGEVMAVYDLRDHAAPQGRWATEIDRGEFPLS